MSVNFRKTFEPDCFVFIFQEKAVPKILRKLLSRTGQVSVRDNNNPKFPGTAFFFISQKLKQQKTSDSSSSYSAALKKYFEFVERNHHSGDRRVNGLISA